MEELIIKMNLIIQFSQFHIETRVNTFLFSYL